jgi:GTP-binding protein Era
MTEIDAKEANTRAGTVALVGRPNAGKSTLINQIVGEHVSIVTHKPQTTRHRVTGIVNHPRGQVVLVDTPGLHRRRDHALNRHLNRVAAETLPGVDLVVVLIDAAHPTDEDRMALAAAEQSGQPYLLVFNKVDQVKHRSDLLPLAREWTADAHPEAVLYISALRDDGIEGLMEAILDRLPQQPPLYPADLFTREPMRFLAAELVREQLLENLHQEIPYGTTVVVESFEEQGGRLEIAARILVAEKRHKGMVIGKGGQTLKRIGSRARQAMQTLFDQPVRLDLNVAVMEGWMDREALFDRLGYGR